MRTSDKISKDGNEDFEVLMARKLWDDLDETGTSELNALLDGNPELRERYNNYTGTRSLFKGLSAEDLEIPELETSSSGKVQHIGESKKKSGNRVLKFYTPLAAAAALLLGLVTYVTVNDGFGSGPEKGFMAFIGKIRRGPETPEVKPPVHLTFSSGTCNSTQGPVKTGSLFPGTDFRTGKDSICDLQFSGKNKFSLRLLSQTRLSFRTKGDNISLDLEKGHILLHADKLQRKGNLSIYSAGHQVRILGTRVSIKKKPVGELHVELLDGLAEVRSANYLHVKSLRKDLHPDKKKQLAAALPDLFKEKTIVLKPGSFAKLASNKNHTESERNFYKELDKRLKAKMQAEEHVLEKRFRDEIMQELEKFPGTALRRLREENPVLKEGKRDSRGVWLQRRKFRNVEIITQEKLNPTALLKREIELQKQLKESKGRKTAPPETLYSIHLKNGKVYRGVLIQRGNKYRMITDAGDFNVSSDDVAKIVPILK